MTYVRQTEALNRHLRIAPFRDRLRALAADICDDELWEAVLDQAGRFAGAALDDLGTALDREGAYVSGGRVRTGPAHRAAWEQYAEGGWLTLDIAEHHGGQGLPLVLLSACEELFNRASAAFMMMPTASRSAAFLIAGHASAELAAAWMPRLADGSWSATICISEPEAGSDVGRIRTRARQQDDGSWRVTGEKCWISFGDHDLAERIGHCLLARSEDVAGVRGLSLFLVADCREDGTRNGIRPLRIEEKMGLHGSPTCVLAFEDAEATLVGERGRGLQQMFDMMLRMRLSCGPQGVGVAAGATAIALAYAGERRQGGDAHAAPEPIDSHRDVRRMLLGMSARVELARGLYLAAATTMDLAEREPAEADRARWRDLAQFLLPIVKDMSARAAFEVSSEAVQVLGGAGYTREWPVERMMRDARVFSVYEGTTGIQGLDLLHRRLWRDRGAGLRAFLSHARADAGQTDEGDVLLPILARLEAVADTMMQWRSTPGEAEAGATSFLDLAGQAAAGWIAVRIVRSAGDDPIGRRLTAAARFHLAELDARSRASAALATLGGGRLDDFADLAGGS